MRVLVTGGAGFVGSNVVAAAAARGRRRRRARPVDRRRCRTRPAGTSLVGPARRSGDPGRGRGRGPGRDRPHRDPQRLPRHLRRPPAAWDCYVGVTRTLADAANAHGAALLTVSTDWVFDGTQAGADEATPPNPINYYGVLKTASEVVTLERAREPIVARIAGVMGTHRAGRRVPRSPGSRVRLLRLGRRRHADRGPPVHGLGERLDQHGRDPEPRVGRRRSGCSSSRERELRGVFHCCGGEATTRMGLARETARAFELDESLHPERAARTRPRCRPRRSPTTPASTPG